MHCFVSQSLVRIGRGTRAHLLQSSTRTWCGRVDPHGFPLMTVGSGVYVYVRSVCDICGARAIKAGRATVDTSP